MQISSHARDLLCRAAASIRSGASPDDRTSDPPALVAELVTEPRRTVRVAALLVVVEVAS